KHSGKDNAGATWFGQKIQQLRDFSTPAFNARGARWIALAFIAGAVGAYGIWENSHRPIEAAPAPVLSTTTTAPTATESALGRTALVSSAPSPARKPVRSAVKKAVSGPSPEPVAVSAAPTATKTVPLRISVNPKFKDSNLTVWVDNQCVLQKELETASK